MGSLEESACLWAVGRNYSRVVSEAEETHTGTRRTCKLHNLGSNLGPPSCYEATVLTLAFQNTLLLTVNNLAFVVTNKYGDNCNYL